MALTTNVVVNLHLNNNGNDSSGNNNHATAVGATYSNSAPAPFLGSDSGETDGVDDRFTISDHSSIDFSTDCTIATWFYPRALTAGVGSICHKGSGSYFLGLYSTGKLTWGKDGSDEVQSTTVLSLNTKYCVIVTRTGGTNYIYVGDPTSADNSGAGANFNNTAIDLHIGSTVAPGSYQNMLFDEFTMASTAWTQAERLEYYNSGVGKELRFGSGFPFFFGDEE
jgi:hypothetical protein